MPVEGSVHLWQAQNNLHNLVKPRTSTSMINAESGGRVAYAINYTYCRHHDWYQWGGWKRSESTQQLLCSIGCAARV